MLGAPEEKLDLVLSYRAGGLLLTEALEKGRCLFGDPDVFIRERLRAAPEAFRSFAEKMPSCRLRRPLPLCRCHSRDMIFFMANHKEKNSAIAELAKKHGLALVVLFGSQATGKTHRASDVDIGFTAGTRFTPGETAELAFAFSEALHAANIDLIDLRDAPPLLLKNIALNAQTLFEAEPRLFSLFRIYALKRYMETARLRRLRAAALDSFLEIHARQRTR